MTAGVGFIGLAAMIVGRWTPLGAFGAALLFASSVEASAGRSRSRRRRASSASFLDQLPAQFFDALPYIVTIIVLAGVVGRSIPPAATASRTQREARPDAGRSDRRGPRDRERRAILDLQEGRGPVPVLDDAGIRDAPRGHAPDRRRRGVVRPVAARRSAVFRYLVAPGLRLRAGQPERARRSSACRPSATLGRGGRRDRAVRHRRRLPALGAVRAPRRGGGRGRAPAACGSSSASWTGRRPGSPTTAGWRS